MQSDHAPTPFSAAQIRAACPVGRVDTFLIESADRPPVHQTTRFVHSTFNGAVFEASMSTLDGKPVGEPLRARATWDDLQAHASHPASTTRITDDVVRVPAGSFDCWVYTVTTGVDVQRLYFAKDLAGPPVRAVQEVDGEERLDMQLVEHRVDGS